MSDDTLTGLAEGLQPPTPPEKVLNDHIERLLQELGDEVGLVQKKIEEIGSLCAYLSEMRNSKHQGLQEIVEKFHQVTKGYLPSQAALAPAFGLGVAAQVPPSQSQIDADAVMRKASDAHTG